MSILSDAKIKTLMAEMVIVKSAVAKLQEQVAELQSRLQAQDQSITPRKQKSIANIFNQAS